MLCLEQILNHCLFGKKEKIEIDTELSKVESFVIEGLSRKLLNLSQPVAMQAIELLNIMMTH